MMTGELTGRRQLDLDVAVPPGRAIAGLAVGIIVVDAWYPMLPGNVANASTFRYPVMYEVLRGASISQIMHGDPALLDPIIEAGERLVRHGVRSVVGACGSFANYQSAVAAALSVPTFLSVMLQAPLILRSLRPDQKLGVIAASPEALTPAVFHQCGIAAPERLIVTGAAGLPEFARMLACEGRFNSHALEGQLVEHVRGFVGLHPEIGALLLQCSDLPPYSWSLQNATGLPVFDMVSLIDYVYTAVVRRPLGGFV